MTEIVVHLGLVGSAFQRPGQETDTRPQISELTFGRAGETEHVGIVRHHLKDLMIERPRRLQPPPLMQRYGFPEHGLLLRGETHERALKCVAKRSVAATSR